MYLNRVLATGMLTGVLIGVASAVLPLVAELPVIALFWSGWVVLMNRDPRSKEEV